MKLSWKLLLLSFLCLAAHSAFAAEEEEWIEISLSPKPLRKAEVSFESRVRFEFSSLLLSELDLPRSRFALNVVDRLVLEVKKLGYLDDGLIRQTKNCLNSFEISPKDAVAKYGFRERISIAKALITVILINSGEEIFGYQELYTPDAIAEEKIWEQFVYEQLRWNLSCAGS